MNYQEQLLKEIRKQLQASTSINDAISSILNCSYDAAHRRVSMKSKFSIDETVLLANHFNISIDNLFSDNKKVIIEKTNEIKTLKDMMNYFKDAANRIEKIANDSTTLYYSAKDIPLFYFMDGTIMSKFKLYVWLQLLNPDLSQTEFEKFVINEAFMEDIQKLKKMYQKATVKEVWNDTTINSSLQQIIYFYEASLVSFESANALLKDLKRIVSDLKNKANKPNSNYSIYYNELILLNNNMIIETNTQITMFVPYTLLGYFITEDKNSCKNALDFFNQQITNSKPLNQSGIKDLNLFFNKMNRKIDHYTTLLNKQIDVFY
jgi:hypothetical protein